MKNIIEIIDLNFNYKDKNIFNKFNLNIKNKSFTTIIGSNGCGKTTLTKILLGVIKTDADIFIDNMKVNNENIASIRSEIGYMFENPNDGLIMDTVKEELFFSLQQKKLTKNIKNEILEVAKQLGIEEILNENPKNLSGGEKQLVSLAITLLANPKIIILDEAFTMIDNVLKDSIFKILKKLNQEKGITIINITHDIEESLYGKEIIIIDDGKVLIQGLKEEILIQEKILKKINLNIPFMVDLSLKLKYYNLIDKLELDMDKLVNKLWK